MKSDGKRGKVSVYRWRIEVKNRKINSLEIFIKYTARSDNYNKQSIILLLLKNADGAVFLAIV